MAIDKEALGAVAVEPARRRYDAVFFDMGYTLIHFEPRQSLIFQQALREIGAERSVEQIKAAVEAVYAEITRDAATATFPATQEHDQLIQGTYARMILARLAIEPDPPTLQAYASLLESWFNRPGVLRTYPEVIEVLDALHEQGYRLGIVSNWSWNLRTRVAQVGLTHYFEVIWASAYAGCSKPHPDIFRQALAHMPPPAIAAECTLYVGDSYWHDVVGARSAGLDAVLLDRASTAGAPDCPVIQDLRGVFDLLGDSRA